MPRLKILLSYDGSDFGGWQRQDGGPATVQGELEKGLTRLFETPIHIMGSGRTDRGFTPWRKWPMRTSPSS